MATTSSSSDDNQTIAGTTDIGAIRRLREVFTVDMLARVKSIISVLIDIGRLIDKGMATWHALGFSLPRHA